VIIDAHTHLYSAEMTPDYWLDSMAAYGSAISDRTPEYVRERIERDWFDPHADTLIADMDAAGIDRSVVFVLDFGLYGGVEDSISLARRYELFAAAVARHPGRLSLYGGIDPRRPDAPRFIERAADEHAIAGVKLWTPAGVFPDDRAAYRVYAKCAELKLPVVVHTGQEIAPLRSESTRPILVDQAANDFPEVTFVLAHAGMAWVAEAAEIAWHHPNVYLDIAYWQAKYLRSPERFARELRELISTAGPQRVMFGTDWPALRTVRRVKHDTWVRVLRELPESSPGGVSFSAEEIDRLMGINAQQALGIGS
jgi:predicted TIM-barrel fold metal-dependent hydrolase